MNTVNEFKKINKKNYDVLDKVKKDKSRFNRKKEKEVTKKFLYDRFISDLIKYSSKTPMLENKKQKVGKVIRSLLEERKKVGRYTQHFVKLDGNQIYELLEKCAQALQKRAHSKTSIVKMQISEK